jgi:DNA polymerase-3 subunit delta'
MLPICREKQLQLSKQYQQNTLAHAIIFQGVTGSGKEALAQWLIELLICIDPKLSSNDTYNEEAISIACGQCKTCLLRKGGSYPDHLLLTSENKTLGVDDVRRGNSFLEKTAHLGQMKTILIPQAQLMTVAAANALLKTLEEPSQNSFIILQTEELDTLLPTIVSRCSIYAIRPLVGEALLAQLKSQGSRVLLSDDSNKIVNDSSFVNLSQLAELTDEHVFQQYEMFEHCYIDYLYSGQSESKLLSQLVENKHGIRWLEKVTCNLVRKQYLEKPSEVNSSTFSDQNITLSGSDEHDIQLSAQVLNTIYQAIISSNKLIKSYTQANRQFVAEQLLMMINDIVRPPT